MFFKNWGLLQNTIILLEQINHDISYYSTSRRNFYIILKLKNDSCSIQAQRQPETPAALGSGDFFKE